MTVPEPRECAGTGAEIINLDELALQAKKLLSRDIFDYLDGGSGRENTQLRNRSDIDAIELAPLTMRDVSRVDVSTRLLGSKFLIPIGISPTALHRLVHPQGEVATAAAAAAIRIPYIVSAMSSTPIEEIADVANARNVWFQTYVYKDRSITSDLAMRAKAAGCQALVVTVGSPVMGYRDRNITNRFRLPEDVSPAHFERTANVDYNNPIGSFAGAAIDPAATWKDIETLVSRIGLPVIVKGIINSADVEPALDAGAEGLIVSNHGGRQLDTTVSTIRALPLVSASLRSRVPLMVDSGFRRGTDVLKALALGADAVFLGRPVLWALAIAGTPGVSDMIECLAGELRTVMRLVGCTDIADLRKNRRLIIADSPSFDRTSP